MKYFFSFIFLLPFSLFSAISETQYQALKNSREVHILNTPQPITPKVDIASGNYLEDHLDLTVAGIEPLSLRRFYHHMAPYDPRYGGWYVNPESAAAANFEYDKLDKFVSVGEESGTIYCYEKKKRVELLSPLIVKTKDPPLPQKDYTHSFQFAIDKQKYSSPLHSGQHHPLNTSIYWAKSRPHAPNYCYTGSIVDGSGKRRHFTTPEYHWTKDLMMPVTMKILIPGGDVRNIDAARPVDPDCWTPYQLLIKEEQKPNGNTIVYEYQPWKKGPFPHNCLLKSITAYNSAKTKILSQLTFNPKRNKADDVNGYEIVGSDGRRVDIKIRGEPLQITHVKTPSKELHYSYNNKGFLNRAYENDSCILATCYDDDKVMEHRAPIEEDGSMGVLATYRYQDQATVVRDALGHKTIYRYTKNHRLKAIETYDNGLYRTEEMSWDAETGNLLAKTLSDGNGKILLSTNYTYDKNHNPIKEKTTSGDYSYTISRTFSDDGFNLKLSESDRPDKITRYSYLPNTNLLAAELIYEGNTLRHRTFHSYDDAAVCIQTIVDDGSTTDPNNLQAVSCRHITRTKPKESLPCYGLPEEVTQSASDASGKEILLKKILYTYTPFGQIASERYYDADNKPAFSITHTYDDKERRICTTDAVGVATYFTYDNKNRLIAEEKLSCKKSWIYDGANRPIQENNSGLITKKRYDKLGQCIATVDESGFETRYDYDALGRVISIHHPDQTTETFVYDCLDHLTEKRDANGHTIRYQYNFRGQPTLISYSDGSHESYTYYPHGTIATYTDKNGATTHYSYDIFDHCIEQKTLSSTGAQLKQQAWSYSPFYLCASIDALGVTTTYRYDAAGRKIHEERGGKTSDYGYDSLGRLSHTIRADTVYITHYDNLDRPIEKRVENLSKQLLRQEKYQYDGHGNCTHTISSKGATVTQYNAHNLPIKNEDPLGNTIQFIYHYLGGFKKTVIDPLGRQTVCVHDCRGREKEVFHLDTHGNALSRFFKRYDGCGNCIEEKHEIFEKMAPFKTITHTFRYGANNRLEEQCEAGLRCHRYLYDNAGKLTAIIKPDGVQHHFTYDALGRQISHRGPDFDYRYSYNALDQITTIHDGINTTLREYDALGRRIYEKLASGIVMRFGYDKDGRRTHCFLPNDTPITYNYHADRLHTITYANLTHTYETRDLEGHVTQVALPANKGHIYIERDACSRFKQIRTPAYTALFDSYDAVGNLCHYSYVDAIGSESCEFSYDDLNQLISEKEHNYRVDSLSNRLAKDDIIYAVNALNEVGPTDSNGNLRTYDGWTLTYDSLDRLVSATKGTMRIDYTYDPLHRRLTKTVNGDKTLYIWDGDHEIGALKDDRVEELRILGEGVGAEIGAAVLCELQGYYYIPIHNHQGSIVALLDLWGRAQTIRYTAFGEQTHSMCDSPWRFAAKRYDAEIGLSFFGRRYYIPPLGRWLTADPAGFADGPNLYAYLHHGPFTDIDAYGLFGWKGLWENTKERAYNTYHNERFQGVLQGLGGLGEVGLGGAFTYSTGGLAPLGWGMVAHGLDNSITGFSTAFTGRSRDTITSQLLQDRGMARHTANFVDGGIGLGGSLGALGILGRAGALSNVGREASFTGIGRNGSSIRESLRLGKNAQALGKRGMGSSESSAASSSYAVQLKHRLISQEISAGHAFEKHILNLGEFPGWIRTRKQFAHHIESVLNNPTSMKELRNGRIAFWHEETRTVVIRNPSALDGGTAFQPLEGTRYFETLR